MRTTAQELASAISGELIAGDPGAVIERTSIDSRDVGSGELFVPLVAARDGHEFVGAAFDRGATASLWASSSPPTETDRGRVLIRVDDTYDALVRWARYVRAQLSGRVVGITGSVGKTTAKDLAKAAMSSELRVSASERSFNNEFGVPLTLANADDASEAVLVEMGARGPGHVAFLCDIATPDVGAVLAIGGAHLEQFGSLEGVAQAKGELVEALEASGTAVLNAGDPLVAAMAQRTRASVLRFGDGGDVRAERLSLDERLRAAFTLVTPWGNHDVRLAIAGEHHVTNALAAAAIALTCGASLGGIARGLADAPISPWRMELIVLPNGLRIINDAYNANPTSMEAALASLAQLDAPRRVAVLGEMAELGPDGPQAHRRIAAGAAERGIEVWAMGTDAYGVDPLPDVASVVERLGALPENSAVLVKGSRVARMERIAEAMVAAD